MKIFKGLAVGVMALALAGCQQGGYSDMGPKQGVGTLGGAVIGGLAASQIGGGTGRLWATGAGVLLGALVGSEIGKSLDRADRQYMAEKTQYALESGQSGQPVEWRNPDSGHYGTVTPQRAYQANDSYCREYTQTVSIGGKTERAYGTACRQPDGSWQIVNN
jgi:surface antigen